MSYLTERPIRVFLYGSFMHPSVLIEKGLRLRQMQAARLENWAIGFTPYATVFPCPGKEVWGVTALASPVDLDRVYDQPLFGGYRYYPEAVLVTTQHGERVTAIQYVSFDPVGAHPPADYLRLMLEAARKHGFPDRYRLFLARHSRTVLEV